MRSWLSTPPPRPPQLEVELEQTHLQRVLEPLAAVDGRTVLTIGDDGLVATSVDDFMVTSVEAALHQSLCRGYEAAPGTIVIDAAALLDVLEAERDGDSLAELTYAPDGSTLTLSLPSFVHTQTVDVGVTVDRPDIDDSSDGVTTYHAREELAHAFEYFTDRSSVVALGYDETDDECYLEAVSTGEAAPKTTTRHHCPREQLPNSSTPEPVHATFSTARLGAIVDTAPPKTTIRADYAESYPIRLAWDLTGGSGIGEGTLTEVTALLAPRDVVDTDSEE